MHITRALTAVVAFLAVPVGAAEQPTPTPTPAPQNSTTRTTPTAVVKKLGGGGTMGGAMGGSMSGASRTKRTGTPVVIDSTAIKELSGKGSVTVAPNRPAEAPKADEADTPGSEEAIIAAWAEAKARVASAEATIERFEKLVAEDKENRWWRGEGATEPGITKPPVVVKREALQAELAEAQKELATAERRAAAAGLDVAKLEERLVLTPK